MKIHLRNNLLLLYPKEDEVIKLNFPKVPVIFSRNNL